MTYEINSKKLNDKYENKLDNDTIKKKWYGAHINSFFQLIMLILIAIVFIFAYYVQNYLLLIYSGVPLICVLILCLDYLNEKQRLKIFKDLKELIENDKKRKN